MSRGNQAVGISHVPSASLMKRSRWLEHLSLGLCGALALAFAIMVPPLQISDEHGHFIRAYVISRGEFVARGTPELPEPVAAFLMGHPEAAERVKRYTAREILGDLPARAATGAGRRTILSNADGHHPYLAWAVVGSATYFPLVYLPASLGILTARILHLSPLAMMYAARIFNVLIFVAALAVSFRLAPRYRCVMTAVALMPMALHQAGGISADPVTIALSFVGLSLVLHAREHPVGRRFVVLVAVLFVIWGLSKSSVWSLPLLLLIPGSAFRNRGARLAYIAAVALCMVGALAIWNGIDSANVAAFRADRLTHGIDVSANVRMAAAHSLIFAGQLLDLARATWLLQVGQLVGAYGWTRFTLPPWVGLEYLLLAMVVAATEPSAKLFRGWERGVLLLVSVGGAALVYVALFVTDGVLCAADPGRLCFASAGVQGRYFVPMCLTGLVALRQSRINVPSAVLLGFVTGVGTLHAFAALALIRTVFYV